MVLPDALSSPFAGHHRRSVRLLSVLSCRLRYRVACGIVSPASWHHLLSLRYCATHATHATRVGLNINPNQ